jgi:hypothetical protein
MAFNSRHQQEAFNKFNRIIKEVFAKQQAQNKIIKKQIPK